MRAIIGTWKMSFAGVSEALDMMKKGVSAGGAVVHAVKTVEDNPAFHSVGFGGLPGRDGRVTLDAAFMDGRSLRMGGVMSVENIQTPFWRRTVCAGGQPTAFWPTAARRNSPSGKGCLCVICVHRTV